MSIAYDALEIGFNTELDFIQQNLSVERTGQQFIGVIDPNPAVVPDSLLGDDPREFGVLELRQDANVDLVLGDVLIQDGDRTWSAVKRDNNPADFKVKYWLQKIV